MGDPPGRPYGNAPLVRQVGTSRWLARERLMNSPLRNFRLLLEYDGTAYFGWQRQAEGDTVQQKLEEAVAQIIQQQVTVHGAGRTDSGVHARGQVAHFKCHTRLPAERLRGALNAVLPRDVAVLHAEEAREDFHARFSARGKVYQYTIWQGPARCAIERNFCWHFGPDLDIERMRRAAAALVGEHDFAAFCSESREQNNTVRTLHGLGIEHRGNRLVFTCEGDGFLYNMVRAIVGTLVEVGRGKLAPEAVAEILASRDRGRAGPTAPPQGLCLMEVIY